MDSNSYDIDSGGQAEKHWYLVASPKLRRVSNALRIFTWGLIFLAIVFFAPDAGQPKRLSFFHVATASTWRELGDWSAAWCSFKIILLCGGTILILDFLTFLASCFKRETLQFALALSALLPGLGVLAGFFCLLKALL